VKLTITMKDPDCLYEQVEDAIDESVASIEDEEEREAVARVRREAQHTKLCHWFTDGEYLNVEFDTDAMTATVLPVKS
jgi:Mg2+/Co2+ transporter CorC